MQKLSESKMFSAMRSGKAEAWEARRKKDELKSENDEVC
jgi:hypothetical protein